MSEQVWTTCRWCDGKGLIPCYDETTVGHCACWGDGRTCCRCGDCTDPDEGEIRFCDEIRADRGEATDG